MHSSRFAINLITNLLNFAVGIIIGLFFTPYLIRHLGVAGYGLVPLAMSFTNYLGILTIAINAPLGRFMTFALVKNENEQANRIFNTALWATLGILTIACFPLLLFSWKAVHWLNVPPGMESQFSILAICTVLMFYLSTLGSIFGISAFCHNRLDLISTVSFLGNVFRVVIVVGLFAILTPAVWMVAVGMLVSAILSLVISIRIWNYLTPQLSLSLNAFSLTKLREMANFGGWSIINQIGTVLYLSIDLLVVNMLLGAEASGRYASVMIFSGLLRNVGGVVGGVFGPMITTLFAKNNTQELVRYSRQAVKFVGLAMALPIALVCGFSRPLLGTWLGSDFESLALLMSLMTIHLSVNLAVAPLFNVQVATGNVRLPGLLTCGMGILNLGLALVLAGAVGWGMYGVAAAGAIMLTLKNAVFTPLYNAHCLKVPWYSFLREIIISVAATVILTFASWSLSQIISLHGWWRMIFAGTAISVVWCVFAYFVLLNSTDRGQVHRMLPRTIFGDRDASVAPVT